MGIGERLDVYRKIEAARNRPLIAFVTSTRSGLNVSMAADVVREFIDQIEAIHTGEDVDILIHSSGGDALAAWKLMSVLRERFKRVGVLVPYMAFSAATLFALGADEILMHRFASLGPIDPQITITLPDGKQRKFAYEDVGAYLRFVAEEGGISEQAQASPLLDKLLSAVDPLHVGSAKRASELSADVGARLLATHMTNAEQARRIAEGLNKSFFAHGDAVSRTRALHLQLPVITPSATLEALMWTAYLQIEADLSLRSPFQPVFEAFADPAIAATLEPPAPLLLPANTPANVASQVWDAALKAALNKAQTGSPPPKKPFSLVLAFVESVRKAAQARLEGYLTAVRTPDGRVNVLKTDTAGSWEPVPVPALPAPPL